MGKLAMYGYEFRSLVRRIALCREKPYRDNFVPIGHALHRDDKGHLRLCTRTSACSEDIQNFLALRPWATLIDLEVFRQAWEAGVQWASGTSCSCIQRNTDGSDTAEIPLKGFMCTCQGAGPLITARGLGNVCQKCWEMRERG